MTVTDEASFFPAEFRLRIVGSAGGCTVLGICVWIGFGCRLAAGPLLQIAILPDWNTAFHLRNLRF